MKAQMLTGGKAPPNQIELRGLGPLDPGRYEHINTRGVFLFIIHLGECQNEEASGRSEHRSQGFISKRGEKSCGRLDDRVLLAVLGASASEPD